MSGQPFRIPINSLKAIGGGDAALGHGVVCDTFGCHSYGVGVIPAKTVSAIGNGSYAAGHMVLRKFVRLAHRRHAADLRARIAKAYAEGGAVTDEDVDVQAIFDKAREKEKQALQRNYQRWRQMNANMFLAARGYNPHADQDLEYGHDITGQSGIYEPDSATEGRSFADGGAAEENGKTRYTYQRVSIRQRTKAA